MGEREMEVVARLAPAGLVAGAVQKTAATRLAAKVLLLLPWFHDHLQVCSHVQHVACPRVNSTMFNEADKISMKTR
jgi:hypothetical protein